MDLGLPVQSVLWNSFPAGMCNYDGMRGRMYSI